MAKPKKRKKPKANNKQQRRREIALALKGLGVVAGPLIAALALLAAWKYYGADELRNALYRPLYSELSSIETKLGGDRMFVEIPTTTKADLEHTGQFNRLPRRLRDGVIEAYAHAVSAEGDLSVIEALQRSASDQIKRIRTEEEHASWIRRTLAAMQFELASKPGESGIRSMTMQHVGDAPVLDVRNPNDPRFAAPGVVRWELQDWLGYPDTAKHVDEVWDEKELLCLDDNREDWFYCVTRDDLRRIKADLKTFLEPIYSTLIGKVDFNVLERRRRDAAREIDEIRSLVSGRIEDPKRVSDLF